MRIQEKTLQWNEGILTARARLMTISNQRLPY